MIKLILISAMISFYGSTYSQKEIYPIDDFSEALDLYWVGRNEPFTESYTVATDGDNRILRARSIHSDNFIIKEVHVDLVEYPYLN